MTNGTPSMGNPSSIPDLMGLRHFEKLDTVDALDELLHAAHKLARLTAAWTRTGHATSLQMAGVHLFPQAIQLSGSIRYEIDGAMLFTASVILRPLIERVGMTAYLYRHPQKVLSWLKDWKGERRPHLRDLIGCFDEGFNELAEPDVIRDLHALVHASFGSTWASQVLDERGKISVAAHQMPNGFDQARYVAMLAAVALAALLVLFDRFFPAVISKDDLLDILNPGIEKLVTALRKSADEETGTLT